MTEITGGPSTFIGIAKQSAKGTPQTTAAAFVFAKFLGGTDLQPSEEFLGPIQEGGDGLDPKWDMRTAHRARGVLVVDARPDITGMLVSAYMGAGLSQLTSGGSIDNTGSNPASHLFMHPAGQRPQYYTVVVQHPGAALVQVLTDARPVGLTVEAVQQAPVKLTAEFVGIQYGASFAVPAVTYETGDPYWFFGATFMFPFAGSVASYVTQYTLTGRYPVDENLFTNDLRLADVIDIGPRTWEIDVREIFQNATNYQAIEYNGGVQATYGIATGVFKAFHAFGGAVGGGSARNFSAEANLVRWGDSTLTAVDPDNKTVYVDHKGIALAGGTVSMLMGVVNGHASSYLT